MVTILLVEDDTALAASIQYALEQAGYSVLHADTLQKAETLFRQAQLILLDVSLPDGDGFSFCRQLQAKPHCPLLFLTARDEETDIIHGLELGADDYITKPFRLGELIARIRTALRRAMPDADALEGLTATELKLVAYLQHNAGITLTRSQLLEHLWDSRGEFVDDNTLSVHISRIREKVDADGKKHIQTVRGVGYQWHN